MSIRNFVSAAIVVAASHLSWGEAFAATDEPEDPISQKAMKAHEAYRAELKKILATAADGLDRAEAAARRKGDKDAVTRLKAEQAALKESEEFPASATEPLRKKLMVQQLKVETAYRDAIREHVKAKNDKAAESLTTKLEELRQKFTGAALIAPGKTFRIINRLSGHALSVKTPKTPKGSAVIQSAIADDPIQHWVAVGYKHEGGTAYLFRNVACGLAIGINVASRNRGAEMVVWPEHPDMRWTAKRVQGGFILTSIYSGLVMGVSESSKQNGASVIQWTEGAADEKSDQIWKFIEVESKGR